jgi:hypothetical protein
VGEPPFCLTSRVAALVQGSCEALAGAGLSAHGFSSQTWTSSQEQAPGVVQSRSLSDRVAHEDAVIFPSV